MKSIWTKENHIPKVYVKVCVSEKNKQDKNVFCAFKVQHNNVNEGKEKKRRGGRKVSGVGSLHNHQTDFCRVKRGELKITLLFKALPANLLLDSSEPLLVSIFTA